MKTNKGKQKNQPTVYAPVKEVALKQVVSMAGPEAISLKFIEVESLDLSSQKNLKFPGKEVADERFYCIVEAANKPGKMILINHRSQVRVLAAYGAVKVMKELKQKNAVFTVADFSEGEG